MQIKHKLTLLVSSLAISAIGFGGSTFAWFQVLNKTTAGLTGTIVGAGDTLEVGFRLTQSLTQEAMDLYRLTEDTYSTPGTGYVYWSNGSIDPATLNYVVTLEGFATDNLIKPVTTGSFLAGQDLSFYQRPLGLSNSSTREIKLDTIASKTSYVRFTLLFRMAATSETSSVVISTGVPGYNISFDSGTRFAGTKDVVNAVRLGVESATIHDIIAPATTVAGAIDIGGPMDLNGDGIFDYTSNILNDDGSFDPNCYEIAYGEFLSPLDDDNWGTPSGVEAPANEDGVFFYNGSSYKDAKPLINATPKTATYHPISTYDTLGIPLATTDENGLAEITFSIWLEGWDHACTDLLTEATYGAQLQFAAQN